MKKKDWKVASTVKPGNAGTTNLLKQYGDKLVCVRYRRNDFGVMIKTVEIVTEE